MTKAITAWDIAKDYAREQQRMNNFLLDKGFHTSNEEDTFNAIAADDGTYNLRPYPEFNVAIFRGQSEFYPECIPSIARVNDSLERLISIAKLHEFKILIESSGIRKLWESFEIEGLIPRLDISGLAQHYGLATNILDFTTNPLIAAFFAVTKYNSERDEYQPILKSHNPGVIYAVNNLDLIACMRNQKNKTNAEPIGLQPFPRPAVQHAWGIHIPKNKSLDKVVRTTISNFAHHPLVNQRIFFYFKAGKKLFPEDALIAHTTKIKQSKLIHDQALRDAAAELKISRTTKQLSKKLAERGYKVSSSKPDYLNLVITEQMKNHLSDIFHNKVRVRLAYTPP